MRKFRCPHCGEKSFNVFIPGSKSIGSGKFDRIRICPECDGRNRPNYNYKNIWLLSVYVLLFVSSIIIERFVDNSFVYLVGAGLFLVLAALSILLRALYEPLVPLDVPNGQVLKGFLYRVPHPNASLKLNCSTGIHPLWVYGIKFDNETKNAKFHERFRDGLVPVVFHEKKKGSNTFEVRIIGKKFVPEELLHIGSEFLVEDNDQFICRGKVTGVFEDKE